MRRTYLQLKRLLRKTHLKGKGAGAMAQLLRTLALSEDPGSDPGILMMAHNPSSRVSDALFWAPQAPGIRVTHL